MRLSAGPRADPAKAAGPEKAYGRARFWPVFALFLVLLALAYAAAEWHARADPSGHTVVFYRVIYSIWATILLLTPALCLYVLSPGAALLPKDAGHPFWRSFWTVAYLAF